MSTNTPAPSGPALGFIELRSIGRRIEACGAMIKRPAVGLLMSAIVPVG